MVEVEAVEMDSECTSRAEAFADGWEVWGVREKDESKTAKFLR